MENNLKVRQNGKYYQLGYYIQGKWVNIHHLGSAKNILELVRRKESPEAEAYQGEERTKVSTIKTF